MLTVFPLHIHMFLSNTEQTFKQKSKSVKLYNSEIFMTKED